MFQNTSHSQPDITPPLPPVLKGIVYVFSVIMTLVLLAFIGFIVIEFVADMAGYPLSFVEPPPRGEDALLTEQDIARELKGSFELITPGHQTGVLGPEVVVIYTERTMSAVLPNLHVNGIQHPWEMQFGDNTWFARLQLLPGMYRVQAGEAEAEFFVVEPDSPFNLPDSWMWHRPHLETNEASRCVQCHEMLEGSTHLLTLGRNGTIGAWKGETSCLACHDEKEHVVTHRFVLPNANQNLRCVRCHTIH